MKYTNFQEIPSYIGDGNDTSTHSLTGFLEYIDQLIKEQGLELNPDFQRGHVWTEEQQIKYIEAILRNGATHARVFYINHSNWNFRNNNSTYKACVLVDGLQRYTAIKRFYNNEIKAFGTFYKDYSGVVRGQPFKININDLKTKKEVLQWYLQMNGGGTPHSEEELARVEALLLMSLDSNDIKKAQDIAIYG